ncbi:OmpA family protein [Jannaschia sp. KMU-145]|uniref:OmpA family protein n=1 Tax=Jannaschia halovivens TaxID=3388667 RepID=UPI00396B47A9
MRRSIRSTTALVASLALTLPGLTPAFAQEEDPIRAEIDRLCIEEFGNATAETLRDCRIENLPAFGLEQTEADLDLETYAELAADGAVDATVEADVAVETEAPAEEVVVEEVAPVAEEPVVEVAEPEAEVEVAEPEPVVEETTEEAVVEAAPAVEEAVEEAVTEEATAAEEAVVEEAPVVEEVVEEAAVEDAPVVEEVTEKTAEAPAVVEAEEAPAAAAPTETVEAPAPLAPETGEVAADAAAPAAPMPLTRQVAREQCRAEVSGRENVRACMVDALTADGQTDLAQRLQDRWASEDASGAETESAIAAEIAAQPEPELTAEQEEARTQTEAALATLGAEAGGDEAPAAAAAAAVETSEDAGTTEEETVTAEDVRTSAEDFTTSAVVTESDDGGLTRNQKFALGALGALAVGTILNNRTRVVSNSGDRVVVQRDDGDLQVLKDDDALLRQEGSNVRTTTFDDGSTRTIVTRADGSQVITVRDASLRVLRRVLVQTDGSEFVLIDDTAPVERVDVSTLPQINPATVSTRTGDDALRAALQREAGLDRRFTLSQVRSIPQVRALAPAFEVNTVTFASGSAAITAEQAGNLTGLAQQVLDLIRANPREVFLVEGHTDAVGDAAYNLALSDRRAETLALALNEYFGVPVENMVVQGYGERFLKVPTQSDEQANRRATVRQITGLLQTAAAN